MAMLRSLAARCGLNKQGVKLRQYEAQCGARYLVPAGGPLPAGAPGLERAEGEGPQRRKRLGPNGPPPTVAQMRGQGISTVSVTCLGLWPGSTCYGTITLPLDGLGASDDTVFLDLCRSLRLVCSRCGRRKMRIVPVWPDVRQARATSLGVDTGPAMPGTRPEYRMPGLGDVPPA